MRHWNSLEDLVSAVLRWLTKQADREKQLPWYVRIVTAPALTVIFIGLLFGALIVGSWLAVHLGMFVLFWLKGWS
jgi:hypothetical protein